MREDLILEYDAFIRSIKQNKDVSHAVLLGAGASINSGIQSATDCIWEWKRNIYTTKNVNSATFFKNHKSESVRSSIQKWLDSEGTYPKLNSNEEYSYYAEKAFPIADDRRKYFQQLSEGKEPFIGYKLLCLMNQTEIVKSVWSTNFDGLMERAAHKMNITPIAVNLDNPERIFRNESRNELLYVALHGDYKYSLLKNTNKELDSQNEIFSSTLVRYLNDKNLIVFGYSGRDKSLMEALKLAYSQKGSGRVYWCGYGYELNPEIEEFLTIARKWNREAFYVPTEGFDKTLIHLCKACFEDDLDKQKNVDELLKTVEEKENATPFTLDFRRSDKYIKSNMHPISFPKEVFQFEIEFEPDEKPWSTIKEIVKDKGIVAVPFHNKVFAISTITNIRNVFGIRIKGEIVRVPISKFDIQNVTAFQKLFLGSAIQGIAHSRNLNTNGKSKLWKKHPKNKLELNGIEIQIYEAVAVSLFFDKSYFYLTFSPSLFFEGNFPISKEIKQSLSKPYLEKLFNDKFDDNLEQWGKIIFNGARIIFDFPFGSGSDLKFNVSNYTSYATIQVQDENYKSYQPKRFDKRLAIHKGIQFIEPQLTFTNKNDNKYSMDFHPMRGLINHRPFDFFFNGKVFSNEIKLGVICPEKYSDRFYSFLLGLNLSQKANKNIDYLLDYPGFSGIYKIPIEIPTWGSEKWLDNNFSHSGESVKINAIRLARTITSKIEQLAEGYSQLIITILIPDEWQSYRQIEDDGEKFDLHDYIKAFAAQRNIATQLIEEKTLIDNLKCQIYWWLSLSFYVKSLRTPWLLSTTDTTTAFAGIGYSVKRIGANTEIVLGCSHIYNSQGQGLKYKLSKVDDFVLDHKSNPFLSYDDAFQFGVSIRELFMQSMNTLPQRVVIHKRTHFTQDEIKGIVDSLSLAGISKIDLIEINFEFDVKYFATKVYNNDLQIDGFPISRGTCVITNDTTALLWTHGIVPSVRNINYKYYLGGRSIPSPLKITKHYGEGNINIIANEILGLTKMNWNSFDLYTKLPATISSSNEIARIGNLLSRFEGRMYDYRFFI